MDLEEKMTISILLDYYGNILPKTQYNILKSRFNDDMSLAEIADIEGITRQGVRDSIQRGIKLLYEYEEKLRLKSKYINLREQLVTLKSEIYGSASDRVDTIIRSLEDK